MKGNGRSSQLFSENLRNETQNCTIFPLIFLFSHGAKPWEFAGYIAIELT